MAVILIFMYAPIVTMIVLSFNESKSRAKWGGFSMKWYQALFHDTDHQFIRHQVARFHVLLGGQAQLRACLHRLAQRVAGGNLGDAQFIHQPLGMGSFSCSGRA